MALKSTCKTLQKVADDEPIFVLRAQDVTADRTIGFWLSLNNQIPPERKAEALECMAAMVRWKNRKLAD